MPKEGRKREREREREREIFCQALRSLLGASMLLLLLLLLLPLKGRLNPTDVGRVSSFLCSLSLHKGQTASHSR